MGGTVKSLPGKAWNVVEAPVKLFYGLFAYAALYDDPLALLASGGVVVVEAIGGRAVGKVLGIAFRKGGKWVLGKLTQEGAKKLDDFLLNGITKQMTKEEISHLLGGGSPNAAAKKYVQGQWVHPETNITIKTTQSLAADHIISQKVIKAMPGFSRLSKVNQDLVLNFLANFQGLPKSFNSSKGGLLPALWKKYKGLPLHLDYIKRNIALQKKLLPEIQALIDSLL